MGAFKNRHRLEDEILDLQAKLTDANLALEEQKHWTREYRRAGKNDWERYMALQDKHKITEEQLAFVTFRLRSFTEL